MRTYSIFNNQQDEVTHCNQGIF